MTLLEQRFRLEIDPPPHGFKVWAGVVCVHLIMGYMLIQMGSSNPSSKKNNLVNPLLFSEVQIWDEHPYAIVQLKSLHAITLDPTSTQRLKINQVEDQVAQSSELSSTNPSVDRTKSRVRLSESVSGSTQSLSVESPQPLESQAATNIAGEKPKPLNEGKDSSVLTSNAMNPRAVTLSKNEGGHKVVQTKDIGLSLIRSPSPEYPELSRRNGEQGVVWVAMQVNAQGIPMEVQLKQTSGFNRLDQAALQGVKNWRFNPQILLPGELVHHVDVPVVFKISNL